MVTGQNYAFVQHNRLTFAGLFHFRVARYAAGCRSGLINVGVYQTEFQRCRRTQNLFRTRSVLNTWQFNNDTVSTLTLNHRLRHAKLVYTVTQDINVLLHRIFTRFTQTSIAHYRTQLVAALAANHQVRMALAQIRNGFITSFSIAESDAQAVVVFFTNGGIRDALFTQVAAQAIDILFLEFAKRGVHIHFHQEVNAATQVKAELHRLSVNSCQPARRCRGKVKRHDVFVTHNAH